MPGRNRLGGEGRERKKKGGKKWKAEGESLMKRFPPFRKRKGKGKRGGGKTRRTIVAFGFTEPR